MRKRSSLHPSHPNGPDTNQKIAWRSSRLEGRCVCVWQVQLQWWRSKASLISYSWWAVRSRVWWPGAGSDFSCSGCCW